jgi:hypothetical protein
MDQTLTAQEATMQTLRTHFNHKARPQGRMDFVTYWGLVLTLMDLCRKLDCPPPTNLPRAPRPG